MAAPYTAVNPRLSLSNNQISSVRRTQITSSIRSSINNSNFQISPLSSPRSPVTDNSSISNQNERKDRNTTITTTVPTMSEIMDSSKSQNLHLQLQTLGPFFRITASNLETKAEIGRAEGLVRVWLGGKILHLDSIRLRRETLGMEKSIFGIGLYLGAVAIRHGYDFGCKTAELLAINDTDLYHSKLVRFYRRMGFEAVHEVDGSSMQDFAHMLVWGGKGTQMEARIEQLMLKWGKKFKPRVHLIVDSASQKRRQLQIGF